MTPILIIFVIIPLSLLLRIFFTPQCSVKQINLAVIITLMNVEEINKEILFEGNGISGKLVIASSFLIELEIKVESENEKIYVHRDTFSLKVQHEMDLNDEVETEKLSVSYEKEGLLDRVKDWEEIYLRLISCIEDTEECRRDKELLEKLKQNKLSVNEFKKMLKDLIVYLIVDDGSNYIVRSVLKLVRKWINKVDRINILELQWS